MTTLRIKSWRLAYSKDSDWRNLARLTRIGFQETRFSALKTKLVKEEVTSCARQNSGYAPTERLQLMNVTSPAARNSIPMIVMSHIECWMPDVQR